MLKERFDKVKNKISKLKVFKVNESLIDIEFILQSLNQRLSTL